jgi:hypothetical protein
MRALRARRGRAEAAVECGRRKFAMARKGSTISPNFAALDSVLVGVTESRIREEPNEKFEMDHETVLVLPNEPELELRQQCYNVRINVFHHEQGFPLDAEIDELRLIYCY